VAYATDSDLVARVPATASLTAEQRQTALTDAEEEIDDRVFGGLTLRAHVMLAAHYLQLLGLIPGGEGGLVTSRSAGEISVSYATPDETGSHYETAYGRQFDKLAAKAGHMILSDLNPGSWP